jgi:hypothetical protein
VRLATYRTQGSCPTDCALYGAGCYAENRGIHGRPSPFGIAERGSVIGTDYTELVNALRGIAPGQMVRFNVSGDYLLEDGTPDRAYIEATNASRHLKVLSYTHAWRVLDAGWFHKETRPNASCDSLDDVVEALQRGWQAVIIDPDGRYPARSDVAGRKAVTCLYDSQRRQCIDCGLCAKDRKSVVVFPVHGARRAIAANTLKEAARTGSCI